MLAKSTLEGFSERLAAGTPTPGGGSAAALSGALSASLIQMVCELTLGREAYRQHEDSVQSVRKRAETLRRDLIALVDRDAEAYEGVLRAIRMPKGTPEEKAARQDALVQANLFATETPMAIADACAALMALALELAPRGNPNALSDVGTAALLAYSGLRGGVLNVRINLKGLGEEEHAAKARPRVRDLEVAAEQLREEALTAVSSLMNGA
jgi:formiminotetrahydrofolate cyclodeaminase